MRNKGKAASSKLELVSQIALSFLVAGFIVFGVFFATSILNNVHLSYIRYQSKDIVKLLNERGGGGTGFVVAGKSGKIYILTNRHICKSTELGMLQAIYRNDTYIVKIIKRYEFNDLCLVEAPSTATSGLKVASNVAMGERAYAVGHPLLEGITVTQGELSTYTIIEMPLGQSVDPKTCTGFGMRLIDLSDNPFAVAFGITNICVQSYTCNSSTISIQPGNSGSPVLNIYGHVIGVAFASNEAGSHSYIVPRTDVEDFLNDY